MVKVKESIKMPTYEYKCSKCGSEESKFQSISEAFKAGDPEKCKECKSGDMVRQISAGGGFILKGGGYYRTDFKNK